jgi:hypothetical protein
MLVVTAGELGDPVFLLVEVIIDNGLLHIAPVSLPSVLIFAARLAGPALHDNAIPVTNRQPGPAGGHLESRKTRKIALSSLTKLLISYKNFMNFEPGTAMANGLSPLEGRSFIVGRAGHILVRGTTVSNQHAEIKFEEGRILLRDLDSTNGLYMVTDQGRKRFRQSYVKPENIIYLGTQRTSVQELLDIIYSLTL